MLTKWRSKIFKNLLIGGSLWNWGPLILLFVTFNRFWSYWLIFFIFRLYWLFLFKRLVFHQAQFLPLISIKSVFLFLFFEIIVRIDDLKHQQILIHIGLIVNPFISKAPAQFELASRILSIWKVFGVRMNNYRVLD